MSVVIPVCNEADNVERLALGICAALAERGDFEIIFVDDASTDRTAQHIREIRHERASQIRLLHPVSGFKTLPPQCGAGPEHQVSAQNERQDLSLSCLIVIRCPVGDAG